MLQPKVYVKNRKKVYYANVIDFVNKTVLISDESNISSVYDFDEVIFMENTGLTDKNNNYIYEGDIVKNNNEYFEVRKNIIGEYYFAYKGQLQEKLCFVSGIIEVSGNIFENDTL